MAMVASCRSTSRMTLHAPSTWETHNLQLVTLCPSWCNQWRISTLARSLSCCWTLIIHSIAMKIMTPMKEVIPLLSWQSSLLPYLPSNQPSYKRWKFELMTAKDLVPPTLWPSITMLQIFNLPNRHLCHIYPSLANPIGSMFVFSMLIWVS